MDQRAAAREEACTRLPGAAVLVASVAVLVALTIYSRYDPGEPGWLRWTDVASSATRAPFGRDSRTFGARLACIQGATRGWLRKPGCAGA